ncbi:MAG TPA: hypothetical protein VG271_13505 [Beijerinckiaceae bacterium]|jgi:hypothetical protein|nr:hypothetical protein [Beijerinckiaceae bacterium]
MTTDPEANDDTGRAETRADQGGLIHIKEFADDVLAKIAARMKWNLWRRDAGLVPHQDRRRRD